jgi:acyl-CoA thioesterase
VDEKKRQAYFKKVAEEPYPQLLGIRLRDVDEGYAVCEMQFTPSMTNINGLAHGGAIFSLIDEAFEISSNSHDTVALALNITVTYMRPPGEEALLVAESREINRTKRTASYVITVKEGDALVAACQALVYIKDEPLSFI